MAAILTPRVVRRIAGECTDVDEHGAVGIRLEPAAAIDENQDGTRGSNLLCSANESVSAGSRRRWRPKSRLWRRSGPGSGREKGTSWLRPDFVWPCFSDGH